MTFKTLFNLKFNNSMILLPCTEHCVKHCGIQIGLRCVFWEGKAANTSKLLFLVRISARLFLVYLLSSQQKSYEICIFIFYFLGEETGLERLIDSIEVT